MPWLYTTALAVLSHEFTVNCTRQNTMHVIQCIAPSS